MGIEKGHRSRKIQYNIARADPPGTSFAVERINYHGPNFFLLIPLLNKCVMSGYGSHEISGAAQSANGPETVFGSGRNELRQKGTHPSIVAHDKRVF